VGFYILTDDLKLSCQSFKLIFVGLGIEQSSMPNSWRPFNATEGAHSFLLPAVCVCNCHLSVQKKDAEL
jgi:hypothetical protein